MNYNKILNSASALSSRWTVVNQVIRSTQLFVLFWMVYHACIVCVCVSYLGASRCKSPWHCKQYTLFPFEELGDGDFVSWLAFLDLHSWKTVSNLGKKDILQCPVNFRIGFFWSSRHGQSQYLGLI